jgi:hypothetical protein
MFVVVADEPSLHVSDICIITDTSQVPTVYTRGESLLNKGSWHVLSCKIGWCLIITINTIENVKSLVYWN